MTRKNFIRIVAALPAGVAGLAVAPGPDKLVPPALEISWACIYDRGGCYLGARRFRDVRAGDLIQVLNPHLAVHNDPDIGRLYRVMEDPQPTSDPSTMGDCFLVLQGVSA